MGDSRRSGSSSIPVTKVREIVEGLGYECVGVQMVNEHGRGILRIYIDSLGGIQVRDCEAVSRTVSRYLDENEGLFPGKYVLEVSSPGFERPLFEPEDYKRFLGQKIRLRFLGKVEGKRQFVGILDDVDEGEVCVTSKGGKKIVVPFSSIQRANLVYEEPPKEKPISRKKKKGE